MNTVFYFTFSHDDDSVQMLGFAIEVNPVIEDGEDHSDVIDNIINNEVYESFVNDLEHQYGIHDWSSSPTDNVSGIGYTTYEVDKGKVATLMNKWNKFFVSILGPDKVGRVTRLPNELESANDEEILQAILQLTCQNIRNSLDK